nr:mechanosensitive ion channel family protein [Aphanothece sacrum]
MNDKLKRFLLVFLTTLTLIIFSSLFWFSGSIFAQSKNLGSPVIFDNEILFYIQQGSGTFAPEERAAIISRRLEKIVNDDSIEINNESFDLDDTGERILILFNNKTIATVTPEDAKAADLPNKELAEQHLKAIERELKQYRRERQPFYWVIGIVATIITTIILLFTLRFFNFIFPYFERLIDQYHETFIPSIRIQNLELLSSRRLAIVGKLIVKVIRVIVTLLIIYLFLPTVLSFFPQTRKIGQLLWDYLIKALNIVGNSLISYLPNIFILAIIITLTHYTLRFFKIVFTEIERGNLTFTGFYPEWAQPTYRLLTWLTIALAAVFAFPYLPGFNSPAFQGVSAFIALLFTLGSTGVISNTVSGFVLIYTRAFQISDRVKIGDAVGDVLEKTLLVTRIRTIKNVIITIPNSVIISSNVVNFSALAEDLENPLIINTTITLGYDVPWRKVHQTLIAAADATDYILAQPRPFVFQTALNDFHVSYEINAYTHEATKMGQIYSSLHQNIQDKCNEADIEILSPAYAALRDGNHNTMPENYLPKDYTSPGFRVDVLDDLLNKNNVKNEPNK